MNTQAAVVKVNDLQDGEMRQVSVGDTDVLLARVDGKFYATGAYCSHYKAPLADGVLRGDRVVCPWHNACYSVVTGDQQEPPGLESLAHYEVRLDGENVIVSVPPEVTPGLRTPQMAQYNPDADGRTFVILGSGAAGIHAAQSLRQVGYQGQIVMVSAEEKLPYDRTRLSKEYLQGQVAADSLPLRPCEFFQNHNIELRLGQPVVSVEASAKTLTFEDGSVLGYDALLLATGGKPRPLDIPGADLENVFLLRRFEEAEAIIAAAKQHKQAVAIGSSFIGMEIAASLTQQGVSVQVVSPESVPFEKILGAEIGHAFQVAHEEQGVVFHLGTKATHFEGNGKVEAVILETGERLDADFVVVGVGVEPVTDYLQGVSLNEKDKSVLVNEYLQAADGLYAAGDIARYPDWRTGEATRIEHWRLAAQHGQIAAHNMAGKAEKFTGVPVFWTMQFEFPLRYIGHAEQWDEIIFDGDPQAREFMAFYIKDNQVLAVAAAQRDTEMAAILELMRLQQMPEPDALRHGSVDWVGLLKK